MEHIKKKKKNHNIENYAWVFRGVKEMANKN